MSQTAPKRYSSLMVTLHWLTALLVVAAFLAGKVIARIPNDDPAKLNPLGLHMNLGTITLLIIIIRFIARARTPRPDYASTGNALLDGLGKTVHYALYLLVFLMSVSGIALSAQSGLPKVVFFGSGSLPADFSDFASRALHGLIAPALLLLVALHVGAAFYHQFFIKDNLLSRMWYGK